MPRLLFSASFPSLMFGNSATLRHPHSFCDPRDPETTLSHLGFCSTSPPEHLQARAIPNSSRLLKAALCCLFMQVPSPLTFIFQYIATDSHLHNPYLPQNDQFSTCRIAAIIFSYLDFADVQNDLITICIPEIKQN